MSQIVDQRLFELVQLVSLSRSFDNESRRSFSFRSTRQSPGPSSRHPSRQIVAFTASPCGRLVIFAAADLSSEAGEGHSNNGNEVQTVETRPFIGAALLSKSQDSSPTSLTTTATTTTANCDSNRELVEAEVLWLPWFQDTKYRPTCLTLSPESDFCLIGCENGSLFIISTKTLCPGFDATRLERDLNHKEWTNKKTHRVFPIDSSLETKAALIRSDNPSSVTWWSPQDSHSYAILGTQSGWIVLIDLASGKEIGYTHLTNFKITCLEQLCDEAMDCTYLFITNEKGKQWRLLLERKATGYTWCSRKNNVTTSSSTSDMSSVKMSSISNGAADVTKKVKAPENEDSTTRSRLAGFKQMSVASLASLRQRLSESKRILDIRGKGGGSGGGIWASSHSSDALSSGDGSTSPNAILPESLACKVGDTQLSVQMSRDEAHVLAGLFPDTSILTLHNSELEVLPQVAFRLPRHTDRVLILDKVMLVANKIDERSPSCNQMTLQVVSSHHAEIHLESRSKEDPVLQNFALSSNEKIIGFHRLRAVHVRIPASSNSSSPGDEEPGDPLVPQSSQTGLNLVVQDQRGVVQDPKEQFISQVQTKLTAAKARGQGMFEPCLVVTSNGVFVLKCARDPVTTFLECAMQGDIKTAEHTASTFDLDGRGLLELAADIRLSKRDFPGAIALYRLSGCKHLKVVLKFASSGHVHELLSYLLTLFKTSSAELTFSDRIHLSNLTLMAYFQQALTKNSSVDGKAQFVARVCAFMDENHFFDSGLAVRLAAETREWSLLHHLCHTRGLYREMLATICSTFSDILEHGKSDSKYGANHSAAIYEFSMGKVLSEFTQSERKSLWLCLSNANNLTSCVALPNLGLETLRILMGVLPAMDATDLEAQAIMCCPNRPDFRPFLRNLMVQSNHQSLSPRNHSDKEEHNQTSIDDFVLKLLNYYVTVELLLLKKMSNEFSMSVNNSSTTEQHQQQNNFSSCDQNLVKLVLPSVLANADQICRRKVKNTKMQTCKLIDAGFNHVLVTRPRSGALFSFGATHFGVLGHNGPLMTSSPGMSQQHSAPKQVEFFALLNREADAESQMSDGDEFYPKLGSNLDDGDEDAPAKSRAAISVLSVACGKTHSMALTDCGLYTWGSSKYGQLGLGRDQLMSSQPSLVTELCDVTLVSISAGSYHSAAVDEHGSLWTWGWGVHGQLGLGDIEDEYLPRRVLDREMNREAIVQVEAGYAHTIALTDVGHVWVFGCGLFGQLGNGENKKRTSPIRIDFKQTLHWEGIDDRMAIIAAGFFHNLAVSDDGLRLYMWGCNPQVLRLEAQQKRKDRMQNALRDPKNDLSPTGTNENGSGNATTETKESEEATKKQLEESYYEEMLHFLPSLVDVSAITSPIVSVACGNQHSMILTADGSVYSFGRNIDGQLGIGSRKESKIPTQVVALKDDRMCQIACGGDYSLALSESGSLFAWGNNTGGQLGKPPLDVSGKDSDKVVVMKGTKRIIRLPHSLQNSCDVPKPVIGLTTGVYSDEVHDLDQIRKRFVSGCLKMGKTIRIFSNLKPMQPSSLNSPLEIKIRQHRMNLHLCLESFYTHLDGKKMIKKCLISENPQAAAKICLLKDRNILQAFEMSLQACIKQKPPLIVQKLSQHIFEAFHYYIHYKLEAEDEDEGSDNDDDDVPAASRVKQRLLERLIACWQDQKFSFVHLERLLLEQATPVLLQTLVLTLFNPNKERDEDEGEGPMAMGCGGIDSSGPKLVDMFTPEFCLKIGDTFVKSFRSSTEEKVPEHVDRWLQHRAAQQANNGHGDMTPAISTTSLLNDQDIAELKNLVRSVPDNDSVL